MGCQHTYSVLQLINSTRTINITFVSLPEEAFIKKRKISHIKTTRKHKNVIQLLRLVSRADFIKLGAQRKAQRPTFEKLFVALKLGVGVGCSWIELSLWKMPNSKPLWNRPLGLHNIKFKILFYLCTNPLPCVIFVVTDERVDVLKRRTQKIL